MVADSKLPLFVRNDSKVARIGGNGHVGNFTGGPLINLDKGEYDIVIIERIQIIIISIYFRELLLLIHKFIKIKICI